jgi:hypothetical protein
MLSLLLSLAIAGGSTSTADDITIAGSITDAETSCPLKDLLIQVSYDSLNWRQAAMTDADGGFGFELTIGQRWTITFSKLGYVERTVIADLRNGGSERDPRTFDPGLELFQRFPNVDHTDLDRSPPTLVWSTEENRWTWDKELRKSGATALKAVKKEQAVARKQRPLLSPPCAKNGKQ